MSDITQRIENFKKMAHDDPDNELGHFSLGKAYLEAERLEDAQAALQRVIELNSGFSKAYQHLAEAQLKLGRNDDALSTLQKGYEIAHQRGDVMPRDTMAGMLTGLGAELPQLAQATTTTAAVSEGQVKCCRCGHTAAALPEPPMKGQLGEQIHANVCGDCWQAWIGMGTKVINELRLDFSHPQAGEVYDAHMKEFLQLPT